MDGIKKKRLFVSLIVFILLSIGGGYSIRLDNESQVFEYTPVTNSFYYNQLTDEEKAACNKIEQQFDKYTGGSVQFEKPISHLGYSRIVQTLMFDGEHSFWPFVRAYPVASEEKMRSAEILKWEEETETPKDITGVYIQLIENEKYNRFDRFAFDISEDGILNNSDEFEARLKSEEFDFKQYYQKSEDIKGT